MNSSKKFFDNGIMYEPCEAGKNCNIDQRSFKTYLTRCLAATAELAPFTHDSIIKEIEISALAAVQTCTAGETGTECGLRWTQKQNDGSLGVGEQMAVLEIIQSNLVDQTPGWKSAVKGTGTSKGDPNAGSGSMSNPNDLSQIRVTTADRVGAGILTALVLVGVMGGSATMIMG